MARGSSAACHADCHGDRGPCTAAGIFIVVSMAMFIMTLITSSVQYFKEKSQRKRREEKRQRVYSLYLENKRKELQELYDRQQFILTYHYPSFEQMKYLTSEISGRIWEKTLVSDDFYSCV